MVKVFANFFWIFLPEYFQLKISNFFSCIFSHHVTRLMIAPYCFFFGLDIDYLEQFEPENGQAVYSSYQDFFKRRFKISPQIESDTIWPCEGYVCDWGSFKEKEDSVVKGQKRSLHQIFQAQHQIPDEHYFINIFLHNHNYHRVHAPVSGTITRISKINGSLIFLRPWFYQRADVSYPAFKNERVIIEIADKDQQMWHMALVGGFGVGTIELKKCCQVGQRVVAGQEVGQFNLGSTVCLALPQKIKNLDYLQPVVVGKRLNLA